MNDISSVGGTARLLWEKKDWAALAAIVAGGFFLRLWILGAHPHIEADGYMYLKIAEAVRAGRSPFDPLFHPLYPLLIAGAQFGISDAERAARLVSVVAGTLIIMSAGSLASRLFGPRVALGAMLLSAVHPLLVLASTYVLSEATYSLLILTAAALTLRATDRGVGWLMGAVGLLLGGAYLVRPEGLLLIPVLFPWWLMRSKAPKPTTRLGWAGVGAGAAGVVALPYLLYLHATLGVWTLTGKAQHNLALDSVVAGGKTDLWLLLLNLPDTLYRYGRNVFVVDKYVLPALFPAGVMVLLALGLFAARPQREERRAVAFLLSLWLPTLVVPLFHIETRVFAPYLPAALVLAARGACWLGERVPATEGRPAPPRGSGRRTWLVLAVVSALLLPHAVRPMLIREPRETLYREAAIWISKHVPQAKRIMDRKPYIAYYSGRAFEPIPPRGDVTTIVGLARQRGVDLLVIDVELVWGDRPDISQLTFPALAPPSLELIQTFRSPDTLALLLYRVRSP